MDRRLLSILLLVLAGCTGRKVAALPPASSPPAVPPSYIRTRTNLDMEVGPSVHVGSFRALGKLTDESGAPVAGATITVTLTVVGGAGPAKFDLATKTTGQNGDFQVTFHLPGEGTFLVEALFAGDARHSPAYDQGEITA
jgi:hypothetical protein